MLHRYIFTLRARLWFLSENELNWTKVVKQVFFCFGQILGQSDFFESKTEISFRIFFCIGRLCWAEIDLEVSKNGSRERFSNSSWHQFNKSSEAHYTELRSTSQSHTKMASLTSQCFIERPLVNEPRIGPIFYGVVKFWSTGPAEISLSRLFLWVPSQLLCWEENRNEIRRKPVPGKITDATIRRQTDSPIFLHQHVS